MFFIKISNVKISHIVIVGYLVLAFFTAIYGNFWGDYDYKGFAYNLGRGLIWPAVWFPAFGKFLGGLFIIAFVAYLTLSKR